MNKCNDSLAAVFLQDELVEELKSVFQDYHLLKPDGSTATLGVYSQSLPILQSSEDEDGEVKVVPYLLVQLINGKNEQWEQAQRVSMLVLICIYDDDLTNQGHRNIMNIIASIQRRFMANPYLHGYCMEMPMEWALQTESSFPFFYGALEMNFSSPTIVKEDELA